MSKTGWWLLGGAVVGALAAREIKRRRNEFSRQQARNSEARVLIIGAGVVGSTYAAHLAHWGVDVTLLARGERLEELKAQGLRWQDSLTHQGRAMRVKLASTILPEDDYDLVIVAVRHTQTAEALDLARPLAADTPILVMQNNPAGAMALCERLGQPHVMLGFPATGGALIGGLVRSLPLWLGTTIIGESDGAETQRLQQTASLLRRAGLRVEVQRRMTDWLATHGAMIAVLAGCAYKNGGRLRELADRPGQVGLYFAALREAYAVLRANGIPITPRSQEQLFAQPTWLVASLLRLAARMPWLTVAVEAHLAAAPDEMRALYDHLMAQAARVRLDAPLLRALGDYIPAE